MAKEDEKEEETPEWMNKYLKPKNYIPPIDDIEDSDDELDSEKRVAIDGPRGQSASMRMMAQSFSSILGKEKRNGLQFSLE